MYTPFKRMSCCSGAVMRLIVTLFTIIGIINVHVAHSLRILALFPTPIRSHYAFAEVLLHELAAHGGHQVDVLTHFPSHPAIKSYREFSIAGSMPSLERNQSAAVIQSMNLIDHLGAFANLANTICMAALQHPAVHQLTADAHREKYDVVITEVYATDCLLPLAHLAQGVIVGVSATMTLPWADERMSNPDNPAYTENFFVPLPTGKLPFVYKTWRTIANVLSKYWYHVMSTIPAEIRGNELFGKTRPAIASIAEQTALLLVNRHFSVDGARALVPSVIEVGGMHIASDHDATLSDELETFLENGEEDILYVSFGTVIDPQTLPMERFLGVLGRVRGKRGKIKVVVNTPRLEGLEENIYANIDLPQVAILCHEKVKLFVSHGGAMSMQEAIHCGVPVLGLSFGIPSHEVQLQNYQLHGAGSVLDSSAMEDDALLAESAERMLRNESYLQTAKKLAMVYKDRPEIPLRTARYWVEHVGLHGGAHLRPLAADFNGFEAMLIDVFFVGTVLFLLFLYAGYILAEFLQELFDHPPPPAPRRKKSD